MLLRKRPIVFTTNTITRLLIISGAYVLLPFLYITRYDHPSADDYGFANMFAQHDLCFVWKQQHLEWTGRYLMPVFFRMDPTCAHSLTGYRLLALFTLLLFTAVAFFVTRSLTKEYLSSNQCMALSALLLGLYLAKTPSIAEAFFWFSGYSLYQYANIFFLLLLMALAKLHRQDKPAPLLVTWCALLCIAIIGCNEVSLIMTSLLVFYTARVHYVQHKSLAPYTVILCTICALFATIEIAAPGNYVRLNEQNRSIGSILWTITGSLSTTAIYGSQWVGPLLAASTLYIPLFGLPMAVKWRKAQTIRPIHPQLCLVSRRLSRPFAIVCPLDSQWKRSRKDTQCGLALRDHRILFSATAFAKQILTPAGTAAPVSYGLGRAGLGTVLRLPAGYQ